MSSPWEGINDEAMRKRIRSLGSPPLDALVREAGVVLEDRIRHESGLLDTSLHGVALVDAALGPEGPLQFSTHRGEQEGVRMLYRGAMQFIRNPPMHRLIDYHEDTAEQFIRLIDALLVLLQQLKRRPVWTEKQFFKVLGPNVEPSTFSTVRDLYTWGQDQADLVRFGSGKQTGSFTFYYTRGSTKISVFTVYTNGNLTLNYGAISRKVALDVLESLHTMLATIPVFGRIRADFTRYPAVKIADAFRSSSHLAEFKNAVSWLRDRVH